MDCTKRVSIRSGVAMRSNLSTVITTPVTVPYVRHSSHGAHWFIARAIGGLLQASGLDKTDIEGLCLSSFSLGADSAVGVTQHLGLSLRWLDHIPMGGAAAMVALRRAVSAVEMGAASVVACVGADTNQVDSFRASLGAFSQFSQDATYPYGAGGANGSFALLTDYYMRSFGARREDFGKLCVDQRSNALKNPHALFRKPLTLQEYLDARVIAEPLHLFDCVMPCAGAEAVFVMGRERARDLGLRFARVLATMERHNSFPGDPIQTRGGWALDRSELYARAGLDSKDIDFVNTYDDYPVISMMQLEDLGFCDKGEGPQFVRSHTFTAEGGSFPINTSGGQLSMGQAGAAGGFLGLTEGVRQVTGTALGASVAGATFGVVSGFGMINYDRGLCCGAAILGGERAE
jgi:acetyl-CoA acetyltransferase